MLPDVKGLIAALIAAHFLADFLFQNKKSVENKSNILVLIKHALVVSSTSYVLCGAWEIWILPLTVFVGHAIIDFIKSRIKTRSLTAFIIDQFAHIAFLIALSIWIIEQYNPSLYWIIMFGDIWTKLLIILAGALASIQAGSVLISLAVEPLLKEIAKENNIVPSQNTGITIGIKKGGKLIGRLERAIIFLLVLSGHPEGVGFLIAAKSIFRFGEIKDTKQRQEVEYIIIGTFMSFGYGLLIAFLTRYLINF